MPSSGGGGLSLHDSNLLHECVNLMKFSPSDTGGDDIIHAIYGDIIHAELWWSYTCRVYGDITHAELSWYYTCSWW